MTGRTSWIGGLRVKRPGAGGSKVDPSSTRRISSLARMTSRRSKGGREMPTTTATRIGFVGLGHMGGTLAARLLAAGYPVYGEHRNRAHAQGLVHDGLQWRDTPREVTATAEIVITSLPDDRVLEAVASG